MPIILDTNCFANVFSTSSAKHTMFAPVLDWVISGKGVFIYGGTKYEDELRKAPKYLPIFRFLTEVGKAQKGEKEKIDLLQEEIVKKVDDIKFDDPHLPAIAIVMKCKLICSEDTRSIPFVQRTNLYPSGYEAPKYYTGSHGNESLLCDNYVDETYKPLCKINKEMKEKFIKLTSKT